MRLDILRERYWNLIAQFCDHLSARKGIPFHFHCPSVSSSKMEVSHRGRTNMLRLHTLHFIAMLLRVTDCRILENLQRYASPTYLPVNYQLLNTESSFFLKEATQDFMRNSSFLSRTELFFIHQARKPPVINATYGTLAVEEPVPLDLLQMPGSFVGSSTLFTFNWKVQTFVLNERIYLNKPKVQVLFYIAGRDWDDYSAVDKLPCVRMFAFHETQEVRGSCRLRGDMGVCVAELEPLPGWFAPPSVVPGRQRSPDMPEGTPVELYYSLRAAEEGGCLSEELGDKSAAHSDQEGLFGFPNSTPMRRIGSIRLFQSPSAPELSEQRLDGNFAVLVPSTPVRQRDTVSAYVAALPYSPVEMFTLSFGVASRRPQHQEVSCDISSRDVTYSITATLHISRNKVERDGVCHTIVMADPACKKQKARKALSEEQRKRKQQTDRARSQTRA
ncbi:transmembrane protein 132C [Pimephales promelas]|nr:transmembrane protein 132C [Pimephales promelas]